MFSYPYVGPCTKCLINLRFRIIFFWEVIKLWSSQQIGFLNTLLKFSTLF
jgi:hypothetical protein